MDPLSIAAGIIAVAQAAEVTGRFIKTLRSAMGTLPGRLDSLNNEVADLEMVLNEVAQIIQEREAHRKEKAAEKARSEKGAAKGKTVVVVKEVAEDEVSEEEEEKEEGKVEEVVDAETRALPECTERARGYLAELRGIIVRIEKAGEKSKLPAKFARANAYRSKLDRLNAVEANIRTVKSTLNLFIGTAHTQQLRRVHVELLAVSTLGHQTHTDSQQQIDALLGRVLEQIGNVDRNVGQNFAAVSSRVESIEKLLQTQAAQQQMYLPEKDPLASPTMRRKSTSTQLVNYDNYDPPPPYQQESVNFHVATRTSMCRLGCMCACHNRSRAKTPGILDRVVGQLFLDYAGIPGWSGKCDDADCKAAQGPRMQAEYWFPAGVFWSRIIRFQVAYQSNLGPSFQLSTLRRVPDTAEAVTFAMTGNIAALRNLFVKGLASPVDVSETRGYSLLRWAMYSNQYKTCRFLLDYGADPDYRPKALSDNSPRNKACDIILQGGLSQDVIEALQPMTSNCDWIDEQNFTKLHKIITGLDGSDLVDELEAHPESINETDAMGRTALLWAAARGNDYHVATLLRYGADPNIIDCQWSGPVAYSADRNHTVATRLLLEAGAYTDVKIPGGYKIGSPLNCAARNASDPLLIKTLLDFGADVDACGVDGRTSLIHAARINKDDFALPLIKAGADINAMSTAGQTPLSTAVMFNSHRVLKLLLSRWADYNTCPRLKGPHLLELAATYADLETVMILSTTDHFRLKFDKDFVVGDFADILDRRHDADEPLKEAFADLISMLREERFMSIEDQMERGHISEKSASGDGSDSDDEEELEFVDALDTPQMSEVMRDLSTLHMGNSCTNTAAMATV